MVWVQHCVQDSGWFLGAGGLVTGKTEPWLEAWHFQPALLAHLLQRGRRAGNEASIRTPKVWGLGSFQVGDHVYVQEGDHLKPPGTEAPVLGTLPDLPPCSPGCSSVSFIKPSNELVNTASPEFCELF